MNSQRGKDMTQDVEQAKVTKIYGEHSTLSMREAAKHVNVGVRMLKREVENGGIKTKWVGKRRKVIFGSLMAWLNGDISSRDAAKEFLKRKAS